MYKTFNDLLELIQEPTKRELVSFLFPSLDLTKVDFAIPQYIYNLPTFDPDFHKFITIYEKKEFLLPLNYSSKKMAIAYNFFDEKEISYIKNYFFINMYTTVQVYLYRIIKFFEFVLETNLEIRIIGTGSVFFSYKGTDVIFRVEDLQNYFFRFSFSGNPQSKKEILQKFNENIEIMCEEKTQVEETYYF